MNSVFKLIFICFIAAYFLSGCGTFREIREKQVADFKARNQMHFTDMMGLPSPSEKFLNAEPVDDVINVKIIP